MTHPPADPQASDRMLRGSPRYPLLDALRIVAMMDIVSIHVTEQYLLRGAGLPVFIIVAIALGVRKPGLTPPGQLPDAAHRRAWRVLWPWLVWSAFFAADRAFWTWLDPRKTPSDYFYPWMLAGGTAMHLWFLPFIFVAELAVLGLLWPLRKLPAGVVVGGALALALGGIHLTGAVYDANAPIYDAMWQVETYDARAATWGWVIRKSWLFGVASVCIGVAVGRVLSLDTSTRPRRWLLVAAAALLVLYPLWLYADNPLVHGHAIWQWWRQCFALFLVALAVQFTGRTPAWLMRIALLTMGIYILHGWLHSRLNHLLASLRDQPIWDVLWRVDPVLHNYWGRLIVVWVLTALLVLLLRQIGALRKVL